MIKEIGKRMWAIPEGYIPDWSNGPKPEMVSHEAACILNASGEEAHIEITIFFEDKNPIGPYKITIPSKRTKHIRFNNLKEPEPIPKNTNYSTVISSDVPVIVQHTRLDSRQAENALVSTLAYPVE